jgi:hypothetical protein
MTFPYKTLSSRGLRGTLYFHLVPRTHLLTIVVQHTVLNTRSLGGLGMTKTGGVYKRKLKID